MIENFKPTRKQIIVSRDTTGLESVPVFFDRFYFEVLKNLTGYSGAKSILKANKRNVTSLLCEDGLEDMDTPEAYDRLKAKVNLQS